MSTTAEEALQRAKAIAARLSGNDTASMNASATSTSPTASAAAPKRKRWGVAPAIVSNAAQEALPGLADAAKKAKTSDTKKIWVRTTKERGAAHFKSYFADRLGNLQTEVNHDKKTEQEKITLTLKGRGSSNRPALPGMPEEPLHILLSGSEAVIAAADAPVDTLLTEAEQAPVEAVDPEEVAAAAGKTDHSLALTNVAIQQNASMGGVSSGYRPATVAQLIANNPIHSADGGDLMEETVNVPNGIVGFLIGRGGETISSMQARSGCKVQIQKEHELTPGQTNRVITLQATSQDSIDQCRGMIESMVQDRIRAAGGSSSMGGGNNNKDAKVQEALSMGHALVTVQVPDADVGLIIGKSGATIKAIQDQTGAQVQIPPSGTSDEKETRTVSITHPSEEGANMAKRRIEDLLKSKPSFTERNQYSAAAAGPQLTIQIMIPDRDVGLCIGRQGCVIREMQQKSGTRIQIPSQSTPGQPHRIATVIGNKEGCDKVQVLIQRIIQEQSSACVMSNGAPPQQNYYQQQFQEASQSNTAEWQAYHAAQAVAKQGQQQQQAVAAAAAAAAPAPTADTYHEQFFRYAYYYGEPAARQYYGAWSPASGTPNPYGVNPNGITAAPAPAAAPAAAPAPAAQPAHAPPTAQAPRDTSVRRVSNLPAWMTRGT